MTINCSTDLPLFKIGDSFNIPMRFFDQTNNVGIPITPDITIDCKIVNSVGTVISSPIISPYTDQVADSGFFLLSVPSSQTSLWKIGIATLDLKITISDEVRHSHNFSFRVIKGIT
jgi:hypothetical protein